jgi:hypothetical protein
MTNKEFFDLLKQMEDEEHRIMDVKAIEYTQGKAESDKLANFYGIGKDLAMDPKMVLWVYMKKHLDSILCFIKNGKEFSEEKIEGRIHDARNYLAILNAIIQTQRKEKLSV